MKNSMFYLKAFEEYMQGLGYSPDTIKVRRRHLIGFIEYTNIELRDIGEKEIKDYITNLQTGEIMLAPVTLRGIVSSIKMFFKFLYRNEVILQNPFDNFTVQINLIENKKEIFTKIEINRFLESIDTEEPNGRRDRAIFELLYSSGLRRSEVVKLNIEDIDLNERTLIIKEGKGAKDRYVPFSKTAHYFLKNYIDTERKRDAKRIQGRPGNKSGSAEAMPLFLSLQGRFNKNTLHRIFKKYLDKADIIRRGLSLHSIRHTCATHLLEAGADVRYVQELLGHESIQTTVKYTHLLMEKLKKAYKSAHPRENQYFEEIDEEYLKNVDRLKGYVLKRWEINRRRGKKD